MGLAVESTYENKKILIVDDEPKNRKILRLRLEDNFELLEATNGEEALSILENNVPALILLDIMMPGINGYEVVKKVKKNQKNKDTKIILVSSKTTMEDKLEGYKAGAHDYLTKPFNGDELKAKVDVFMKLYNAERQLQDLNSSLEKAVELRSNQLLKAERMASVGMHAGEVVHNLQNPLAIIKGNIAIIKKLHPDLKFVDSLDKATDRILEMVRNILSTFGRDIKSELSLIDINEIINEEVLFLKTIEQKFKYDIELELNLNSKNKTLCSESHISQIISNFIKNSAEAMIDSKQKKITIESRDISNSIEVSIKDTGEGISEENMQKIFEPLYTTKDGKNSQIVGTGLGMPYCKKMIENYGGTLKVLSTLGEGTKVIFTLPTTNEIH